VGMNDVDPGDTATSPLWSEDRRDGALVARLDRPSVRNALNFACWRDLDRILDEAEGDEALRAVIITGGPTVFSAGGDMKSVEGRGAGLMKDTARLEYLQRVLARIAGLSVPTIAAVEGPAVGVAWGLALTCDFLVAGREAVFMAPFAQRRLVPDGGVAWHLVRAVGRLRATEILLAGGKLTAVEALAVGLVSEVVDAGGALTRALAIARVLAATSRDTTRLTLRALRRAEHSSHRDYLDSELELAALNLHNPEVNAARMSFKQTKGD
jgi:2-(1,2-epoxy-1,2-dihydrophenyl)acetyl-CoA isomerase